MRMHPCRRLPLASAFALLLVAASPLPAAALPPAQGPAVPQLAAFDRLMQEFMDKNDISAGQLAIMRHGVVVLDRAYGWQNKTRDTPPYNLKLLPRGALMRVASVSKPFTAAAIRALIAQGKLSLDARVFSLRKVSNKRANDQRQTGSPTSAAEGRARAPSWPPAGRGQCSCVG